MKSSSCLRSSRFTFEKKRVDVDHLAMARAYAELSELEQLEDEEFIKELEELAKKNKLQDED